MLRKSYIVFKKSDDTKVCELLSFKSQQIKEVSLVDWLNKIDVLLNIAGIT